MNKIKEALIKRFDTHRVIFWYDENQELTELHPLATKSIANDLV